MGRIRIRRENLLYVRIDRKRKFLATIFLRAGLKNDEDILARSTPSTRFASQASFLAGSPGIIGARASSDIVDKKGEVVVKSGKKIGQSAYDALVAAKITEIPVKTEDLAGAYTLTDLVNTADGEVIAESNTELTPETIAKVIEAGIETIEIFFPDKDDGPVMSLTVKKDTIKSPQEALIEIYRKMRRATPDAGNLAGALSMGCSSTRATTRASVASNSTSRWGGPSECAWTIRCLAAGLLRRDRLCAEAQETGRQGRAGRDPRRAHGLLRRRRHRPPRQPPRPRRGRTAGEPVPARPRAGARDQGEDVDPSGDADGDAARPDQRQARDRGRARVLRLQPALAVHGPDEPALGDHAQAALGARPRRTLARTRGVRGARRASDDMAASARSRRPKPEHRPDLVALLLRADQRVRIHRVSVPQGRERTRDRLREDIEPGRHRVQTERHVPEEVATRANKKMREGQKAASYEPYLFYLSAWEEDKYVIGQANIELDKEGNLVGERVNARKAGEFILAMREEVQFMDVSLKQLVSVAASLIPFLENDDANRALMGSNMQRQAVPLLRAEALIGTGMETVTAQDSGAWSSPSATGSSTSWTPSASSSASTTTSTARSRAR